MIEDIREGSVLHMDSFHHTQPGLRVAFKPHKGTVAAFILLGFPDKKKPEEFEPDEVLKMLGWRAVGDEIENMDFSKEVEAFLEVYTLPDHVFYDPDTEDFELPDETYDDALISERNYWRDIWAAWVNSVRARTTVW